MKHSKTVCFAALGLVLDVAGTAEQAHSTHRRAIQDSQEMRNCVRHVIDHYIELKQTVDNYRQYEVNTYGIDGRFSWEIARQIMVQNGWLSRKVKKETLCYFAHLHRLTEGIEELDPLRTDEQKWGLHCKLLEIYEKEDCRTLGEAITIASELLGVKESTLKEIRYRFNDTPLPQRKPQAPIQQPAPQGYISAGSSFVLPQGDVQAPSLHPSATAPQFPFFAPTPTTGAYDNSYLVSNGTQNNTEESEEFIYNYDNDNFF